MSILSILDPQSAGQPARGGAPADVAGLPTIIGADLLVPTITGDVVSYANLDHAASAPALTAAAFAVNAVLDSYGSVHRGDGYASRATTWLYERAREQIATFVGAPPGHEVVFTRHTTEALGLLARALPAEARVVGWASDHHAALLPWPRDRATRLPVPASPGAAVGDLEQELRHSTLSTLVVITAASNVTGELWPVAELTAVAHDAGALVCLDASQLVPHEPLDMAALGVDFAAVSGHKMYAPFGAGALIGPTSWLDAATPHLAGGGAALLVSDTTVEWATGPARHEAGTPNVIGAVAMAAAAAALTRSGPRVAARERALLARLRAGLGSIPAVRDLSLFGPSGERVPIVCFSVADLPAELVSAVLAAEHGIGVRAGRFCAHGQTAHLAGDPQTTAVRASLGLATTTEHVDRLVRAVGRLGDSGLGADYHLTAEGWSPVGDPRDLSHHRPW